MVHELKWKIVHSNVLTSLSKQHHCMDFPVAHQQVQSFLKPETSKFTQYKYEINFFKVKQDQYTFFYKLIKKH